MTITDANDERPICPDLTEIQLDKNEDVGYLVLQLMVSDADQGQNAVIRFNRVRDGANNEGSLFSVNPTSGNITTIVYVTL